MGKKIQEIGAYEISDKTLGKGEFSRVELAFHKLTQCEVRVYAVQPVLYWTAADFDASLATNK